MHLAKLHCSGVLVDSHTYTCSLVHLIYFTTYSPEKLIRTWAKHSSEQYLADVLGNFQPRVCLYVNNETSVLSLCSVFISFSVPGLVNYYLCIELTVANSRCRCLIKLKSCWHSRFGSSVKLRETSTGHIAVAPNFFLAC